MLCLLAVFMLPAAADVVRPALVEISINVNGTYHIEIRTSIEALLTDIGANYKNTKDAPGADAYDKLRVLPPEQLQIVFEPFKPEFASAVELEFDGERVPMTVTRVEIPEPGYPKVPRISVVTLEGEVDRTTSQVRWYYPARFGDNAVRVRQVDEINEKWHWSEWQWLRTDKRSEQFSLAEIFTRRPIHTVIGEYVLAGFKHILPLGMDHILFVFGLFLLSLHLKPLLWQVTMFTVAHTITLGLATNGVISLPDNIVEPLIALSIAYVGIENVWHKELHKSRLLLVFVFGLLHGMGFASVLKEFGMPDDAFMTALISFNIGVEFGQLAIILIALFLVGWFRNKVWYRAAIIIPNSLTIAVIGLYWTYDRIVIS